MNQPINPPSEMGANGISGSVAQSTRKENSYATMKWGFADHIISSIGGIHMDNQSISHTTWNCTYRESSFIDRGLGFCYVLIEVKQRKISTGMRDKKNP